MKRVIIIAVLALAVHGSAQAQPVANITLPDPGGTVQLYSGCNPVALTFPNGTTSQVVVQAVSPAGVVQAIWSFNTGSRRYEGFSPAYPQASDLLTVGYLDAVWVCLAEAPSPAEPFAEWLSYDGFVYVAATCQRESWEETPGGKLRVRDSVVVHAFNAEHYMRACLSVEVDLMDTSGQVWTEQTGKLIQHNFCAPPGGESSWIMTPQPDRLIVAILGLRVRMEYALPELPRPAGGSVSSPIRLPGNE